MDSIRKKILEPDTILERNVLVIPKQNQLQQIDLRLSSSDLVKAGKKTDLVPLVPKPIENTRVKYRPYQDDLDILTTQEPPPLPKARVQTVTPAAELPTKMASGSASSFHPIPSGEVYQERTTKSTTYQTDVKRHYINIDTRFRNNIDISSSTNFRWRLYRPIKNCLSMRVASIEIPNNFYSFSLSKQNTTFLVKLTASPSYTTLTLPDGNYTSTEMENELQTLLQTVDPNFTASISMISGKVTIQNLTSNFDIQFPKNPTNPIRDWGLGYNLGFTNTVYLNKQTITAERIINLVGDNYILLKIGDYDGIEHSREKQGVIIATAKIIVNVDKYSILFDNGSNFISKEVLFSVPTNLSAFDVQLLDANNNIIDLQGTDFSFTLEIVEIVNSKLYSNFNDHLLQNNETLR